MAEGEIIVYATSWCGASRRAKRILGEYQILFQWIDIDENMEARKRVEEINHGYRSVPTIIFPDGSILVEPTDGELKAKLGV